MWAWIKSKAGSKLRAQDRDMWFSVDKPFAERQIGKKVGKILKEVRAYFQSNHMVEDDPKVLKKWADGD
eukprot:9641901-Karenia_brevis.AAC.1